MLLQAEQMSLNVQAVRNKYVQLMADLMVVGESTIALLSDTGAGSFVVKPFLDDVLGSQSEDLFTLTEFAFAIVFFYVTAAYSSFTHWVIAFVIG